MNRVEGVSEQQPGDIVSELEAMNVELDYDVMRISPRAWAIHGRVAYDGEVIGAIFASEREAWVALSRPTALQRAHRTVASEQGVPYVGGTTRR